MTGDTFLLFGYGSLQHRVNRDGQMAFPDPQLDQSDFVGDGILIDHTLARVLGGWAALVQEPGHYVLGEVWRVPMGELPALDYREQVARRIYAREQKRILLRGTGEIVTAYAYTCDQSSAPLDRTRDSATWPLQGERMYGMVRTHELLTPAHVGTVRQIMEAAR